jgi:hypothetical protein
MSRERDPAHPAGAASSAADDSPGTPDEPRSHTRTKPAYEGRDPERLIEAPHTPEELRSAIRVLRGGGHDAGQKARIAGALGPLLSGAERAAAGPEAGALGLAWKVALAAVLGGLALWLFLRSFLH